MPFLPGRLAWAAMALALLSACSPLVGPGIPGRDATPSEGTATPGPSPTAPTGTATAAPAASPTAAGGPGATPGTRALGPPEHDGERAMRHITQLATNIGPRIAGTEKERVAAAYIRSEFEASGYAVEIMEFSFEGDRFQAATVRVGGALIDALALAGSQGGLVGGQAVYVGIGDEAGIAGRSLQGKVAIADRGTLRFQDKFLNTRAAGAAALIIVNNQEGLFSGNLSAAADMPVVGVALADGAALRTAADSGATVTVEAPEARRSTSLNVVARPKASGACRVVVGGHHDTVPEAPGATDNASGTANVIELARAFAADGLDEGICFATFGAEESGLYGSAAFVARLRTEGGLPQAMVNLDVTGTGTEVEVIGTPELVQRAITLAVAEGIPAVPSSLPANSGSDHQSFSAVGVPVVFFTSGDFGTIHTPGDTARTIDVDELDRVGDAAYLTIRALLAQVA